MDDFRTQAESPRKPMHHSNGKLYIFLEHMGTGGKFLKRIPMAYALRTRINK